MDGPRFCGGTVTWTLASAIILNIVVIAFSLWLSAPLRHAPMPRVQTRWYDLVLRATMVALLVAVFPIVLSSIMIILHHRAGGPATAAVMANAVIGLGGFGVAALALYLTANGSVRRSL